MGNNLNLVALMEVARLVGSMPWLIVLAIGAIVCLRRLSSQPREGWLVLGAIVLAIFGRFGLPSLVNLFINQSGIAFTMHGWMFPLFVDVPAYLAQAVAWSLLMVAAFGRERSARSRYLIEDNDVRD